MSLRIIEPTEAVSVEHPIFTIFGQPGVCKTSLGFSAENAILLNCDSESALARAVNRGRAINVLTLETLRELEGPAGTDMIAAFSTVVIDPVGAFLSLMAADMIDKNPKHGSDGNPSQKGWGVLKNRFRAWMTKVRAMEKNILLIAHHKEDKAGDTVFVRPDIAGGSKDEVMRISDFVGFLYMNGKERTLDFNPTEAWFGKNPAQWPPWRVPAPDQARTFMAQLFQKGREHLSKLSEVSAVVARQVDDWRAGIDTYKTADEFTKAAPIIAKLEPLVGAQVKKILMDRSKALGLKFDKEKVTFSDQPPAVTANEPQPTGAGLW